MSSAEEIELVNRLATAEVTEPRLCPANFFGLRDRTGTAPHLKGRRLRNMTKVEEANEGEGSACNDSDAQTNLAMSLLAHVVGRQAAKDKMDAAPKVMKAMKLANAMKAMKAGKAATPKAMKAMKPTNAMKAIRARTARRFG